GFRGVAPHPLETASGQKGLKLPVPSRDAGCVQAPHGAGCRAPAASRGLRFQPFTRSAGRNRCMERSALIAMVPIPGTEPPRAVMSADASRAAQGDLRAFERLYREHVPRIFSLMRRMVGSDEATEVTQDVFVRAWSSLASFRGEAAFGTWLHR